MRLARIVGFCLALALVADTSAHVLVLDAEPHRYILQPGQALRFDLPAQSRVRGLALSAEEQGVDIQLRLDAGERSLLSNDGDFLRCGTHVLAINLEADRTATLHVRNSRPGAKAGSFRLHLRSVDLAHEPEARRHAADLIETAVVQHLGDAAPSGEATAVDLARQLLEARESVSDDIGAGRAIFLLDSLLRRENRRSETLALMEQSLPLLQRLGDVNRLASAHNNIGMSHWRLGDGRRAEAPLRRAAQLMETGGEPLMRSLIDSNLCLVVTSRQSVDASVACSERNRDLSVATGDFARIGVAWNNLAGAYSLAARPEQAAAGYLKAIEFAERAGGRGVADPQMNLGLERYAQGRFDEAHELYASAETIYRREDNRRNLALVLRHRAQLALSLDDADQAAQLLQQSLDIQRQAGRRSDLVETLTRLGELQRRSQTQTRVPQAYAEAVTLAEVDANPRVLASALLRRVDALIGAGDNAAAQESIVRAQQLARDLGDDYLLGMAALRKARNQFAQQQFAPAQASLTTALQLATPGANAVDIVEMHALQARILQALQRDDEAMAALRRGIALTERARSAMRDAESRARFVAAQKQLYQAQALAVTDAAFASGDTQQVREALALVARQRSRSLLEQMEQREQASEGGRDNEYRRLAAREMELATARWLARERGLPPAATAPLDDELRQLAQRLAAAQGVRSAPPLVAPGKALDTLLDTLDEHAVAVHYLLGPQHSYAWVVDRQAVRLLRLASEAVLEARVAAAREAAFGSGPLDALADLCDAVWKPLSLPASIRAARLVADGGLQAAPWPALQCRGPEASRQALVDSVEISLMPSLEMLRKVQQRQAGRAARGRRVLAVVDPLYQRDDPRLPAPAASYDSSGVLPSLPRLQASAREARVLRSFSGASGIKVFDGVDASRDSFTALDLRDYRLIHLGLHGKAGSASLSDAGLVFSTFDAHGKPQPAFLNARSIARLQLSAELVVLAACDSAIGNALPGEGLMGTSYAFLAAGADQVVATLAPASDAATSRMMEILYREILQHGSSPAKALRMAQNRVRADPLTRHPRYWAGFVVYGVPMR